MPATHFVVEYRPGNESKWRRVAAEPEAAKAEQSMSVIAPELSTDNAFSTRVVFADAKRRSLAVTGEALVAHRADGKSCERMGPERPKLEGRGADSAEFSWSRPECEGNIQGYEYTVSEGLLDCLTRVSAFSYTSDTLPVWPTFRFGQPRQPYLPKGPHSPLLPPPPLTDWSRPLPTLSASGFAFSKAMDRGVRRLW